MPILLANSSHADGTTRPTIRGQYVRQRLLCQEMPPPPPDLVAPKLSGALTSRQRAVMHMKEPFCAGCHRLMDPIGVAFDRYRADGTYRTPDPAKPDGFDDSGELLGTDVNGKFNGVPELADRLARSTTAAACVPRQWFRWAIGRDPDDAADAPSLKVALDRFTTTGGDLRDLFVSLTQTDAFRFVDAPAAEACR
jgi:hypothetical protein